MGPQMTRNTQKEQCASNTKLFASFAFFAFFAFFADIKPYPPTTAARQT